MHFPLRHMQLAILCGEVKTCSLRYIKKPASSGSHPPVLFCFLCQHAVSPQPFTGMLFQIDHLAPGLSGLACSQAQNVNVQPTPTTTPTFTISPTAFGGFLQPRLFWRFPPQGQQHHLSLSTMSPRNTPDVLGKTGTDHPSGQRPLSILACPLLLICFKSQTLSIQLQSLLKHKKRT